MEFLFIFDIVFLYTQFILLANITINPQN